MVVVSFTETWKVRRVIPLLRKIKISNLNFMREAFSNALFHLRFKGFWGREWGKLFSVRYYELFTFETKLGELNFHLFKHLLWPRIM